MQSSTVNRDTRAVAALLFVSVALIYLSLSPGTISSMGYTGEEIVATRELFTAPAKFLSGPSALGPRPSEIVEKPRYSRNGPVPLLVHGPFYAAGSLISGGDPLWIDRVVAIEPVILSALMVMIVFAWSHRLTNRVGWSLVLALSLAFATMIWPYAYIGLETTQSLSLLVAAWIALQNRCTRSWPRTIAFAVACTFAVSAKSTGAFLVPAVGFLLWRYFERAESRWGLPEISPKSFFTATLISLVFLGNAYYRGLFWADYGGTKNFVAAWLADGPLSFALNLVSFLFSANKGLFVFAPLTLLALTVLPRVFVTHRWLVVFAFLTLGGLAGGFSLLRNWADETWGPRYLHSAIAPLVLCVAASRGSEVWRWARHAAFAALIAIGAYVSFLGAFFSYGSLHAAQHATGQQTLEAIQYDPVWNHIRFNDRLLAIWLRSDEPPPHRTWWTAEHRWFFTAPRGAQPWKSVDLLNHANPQSSMIRTLEAPHRRPIDQAWLWFYVACAIAGAVGLIATIVMATRRNDDALSSRA